MEPEAKLTVRPVLPWATVAITLLAGCALAFPAVGSALIYERAPILHGQVWRAWTGHMVHFGLSHFFWDLAIFLPVGCWLEILWPAKTRWFYLASPWIISATMLAFDPGLLRYAGISGVATGALVLLAGLHLRQRKSEPAWFWIAVLALVGVKIGHELFTGAPLMVSDFSGIRTVPLAHISGVLCGTGFVFLRGEKAGTAA